MGGDTALKVLNRVLLDKAITEDMLEQTVQKLQHEKEAKAKKQKKKKKTKRRILDHDWCVMSIGFSPNFFRSSPIFYCPNEGGGERGGEGDGMRADENHHPVVNRPAHSVKSLFCARV